MQVHGSCAALGGFGVLVIGPAGSGKSDLVLRLLDHGFSLVADDQVEVADGIARPPARLAGLLEVRGLGIVRLPHAAEARLSLVVETGAEAERLPRPERHPGLGLPLVRMDARLPSAPSRVALALACARGAVDQLAGAFTP